MARITVRLTDRTLARLDGLARERSVTRAALVRRLSTWMRSANVPRRRLAVLAAC